MENNTTTEYNATNEQFDEFYEEYANKFGGFVGIQCLAARAAAIFTEEAANYVPGEDYYWVEAIEDFACKAFSCYQGVAIRRQKTCIYMQHSKE